MLSGIAVTAVLICCMLFQFNIETITDENNPMNCPVTTKLVLEASKEEGNKPLIEVNKNLVRKLKPHQVEGETIVFL